MRIAAFLALVPLLAGCNVHSKNPADGDENVSIKADENGQVTFDVPFANGQVKLPAGAMSHSDFDIDGVKMIPGGTITGFNVDAGKKGGTVDFTFRAAASPQDVRSYFVDQFKAKGMDAAASGDSVSGKTKDGDPFVITIRPAAQGSEGTIKVQDND